MALETGNYVGDLVATSPAATDVKSQGDDHLRLIKLALRQSFAGFAGAVIVRGTDGGSANTFTVTPSTAVPAYVQGMVVQFEPTATNTGASTINISGLGAKSLKSVTGSALLAGELVANSVYLAVYDGTEFRLLGVSQAYIDQLAFGTALPDQTGHAGSYPRTNGAATAWTPFAATPTQIRAGSATDSSLTPGETYNAFAEVALTSSAGTVALDMSTFINGYHLFTENTTFANPTNAKPGQTGYIRTQQHASSPKTGSMGSNWKRSGGAIPFTATAGAFDFIVYQVVTSTYILYDIIRNPSS